MAYQRRIIDDLLDEVQPHLPAVVLQGPRAVGKTATAQRRAATTLRMDRAGDRQLLDATPDLLDQAPGPVFVDEWQQFPQSWDLVRRSVDDRGVPGRFILAGSAAPRETPAHSGAGRLVPLRLRPLSLAERGLATPTVSLGDLLRGHPSSVEGTTSLTAGDYAAEIGASRVPRNQAASPRGPVQGPAGLPGERGPPRVP